MEKDGNRSYKGQMWGEGSGRGLQRSMMGSGRRLAPSRGWGGGAQRVFEFLPQPPEPRPGASWGQDGSTALGRRHFTVLGSVWSDREVRTELRSPESPRSSPSVPFTRSGWRHPSNSSRWVIGGSPPALPTQPTAGIRTVGLSLGEGIETLPSGSVCVCDVNKFFFTHPLSADCCSFFRVPLHPP